MISYSSVFSSKVIFLHRAHRFLFACLRPFCILVTHFKFDCVSVRKGVFRARIKQRSAILVSRITGIYDCPAWPTRASFLNSSPLWLFLTMRSYLVICASLPVWKLKCFLKYETVEKKKKNLGATQCIFTKYQPAQHTKPSSDIVTYLQFLSSFWLLNLSKTEHHV